MTTYVRYIALLVASLAVCPNTGAVSTNFVFTKVADQGTPIPSGVGAFQGFETPVLDGTNVSFVGYGASGFGLYRFSAGLLTSLANSQTPMPRDPTEVFTEYHWPNSDSNRVVFRARGSKNTRGIFVANGGTVTNICQDGDTIPSTALLFNFASGFDELSAHNRGTTTVFHGGRSTPNAFEGVYKHNGSTLFKIADENTTPPNSIPSDKYFTFRSPCTVNDHVMFLGWGTAQAGLYISDGTTLRSMIDRNTPVPSGGGLFQNIYRLSASATNDFAFLGWTSIGGKGIYTYRQNALSKVADLTTTELPPISWTTSGLT